MKNLIVIPFLLFLVSCASTTTLENENGVADAESQHVAMLNAGLTEISNGNPLSAIENYFNPIIEDFEKTFKDEDQRLYSARTADESLFYLLIAASDKKSAIVVPEVWAEAHYLKGYASLDLGRVDEAEVWVRKALELSPWNSIYLSELGHIHKLNKRWNDALETYEKAEDSALIYLPDEATEYELLVAMRGIGFSLVELGRLDEAVTKFHECLKIDENDQGSKNELEYIEALRIENSNGRADP